MTAAGALFLSPGLSDASRAAAQLDYTAPVIVGDVKIACPECGDEITGKAKGAGSATWKLSTHRRNKHGVKGQKRARTPRPGAPSEAAREAHPVIATVQDIAAEIKGKGAPTVDQLTAGLGRGLGLTTMGVAVLAVETDPTLPDDEKLRTDIIDDLSLADDDAQALMRPIARLLAPTKINAKYGRTVVDNVDVLGSGFALVQLGMNWKKYLGHRMNAPNARGVAALQQEQQSYLPSPVIHADIANPGTLPGESAGYVLGPEDIERMRAGAQ